MPGRWGLYIALALDGAVAAGRGAARALGLRRRRRRPAARLGLQRAAAAAEAQRLVGQRRLSALCYEGLPWITGAAVMAGGAMPDCAHRSSLAAALQRSARTAS